MITSFVKRKDPCSDPEFDNTAIKVMHGRAYFFGIRLVADKVSI